jgi:hypothetical protein
MIKKEEYILMKSDVPEVTKTMIVNDVNVGGVKLVYAVTTYHYKEITALGHRIPLPWPCRIKSRRMVVLRPYKDNWDTERHKLARNYWGKPTNPLTNLWIEVESDYKDISTAIIEFKEFIYNHELIKHFKAVSKHFEITLDN